VPSGGTFPANREENRVSTFFGPFGDSKRLFIKLFQYLNFLMLDSNREAPGRNSERALPAAAMGSIDRFVFRHSPVALFCKIRGGLGRAFRSLNWTEVGSA
jgi:hypothetical protein